MDRNSVIGLILIGLLVIGYSFYMQPTPEQRAAMKRQGDSIAAIILGSFLSYLSVRFAYQNAMELTDVISPRLVGTARQAANETEGVLRSDDIKMRRVGSEIFVETTIALPAEISFESAHDISAKVEENIAKR